MSIPLEDLNSLQLEIRQLIHDQLRLAALEVRLAAHALMTMIAVAVFIGILLLMAWAGLMGAIGLSLVRTGLDPVFALLVVSALTLGFALLLGARIRHWSRRLGLPATLRALQPGAAALKSGEST